MNKKFSSLAAKGALILVFGTLFARPADSSEHEALCHGDVKCAVVVGSDYLSIDRIRIQRDSVIGWGELEASSKRNPKLCLLSITACALTIFHDYRYYVKYSDEKGKELELGFRFVNDKPAKRLARELTSLTNLASGQINTSAAEKAAINRENSEIMKRIASAECAPLLRPFRCSYKAYLDATPSAQAWASANPDLVNNQMVKMKAIEVLAGFDSGDRTPQLGSAPISNNPSTKAALTENNLVRDSRTNASTEHKVSARTVASFVPGSVSVLSVDEGDILQVVDFSGQKLTVRLACVDAPEATQGASGAEARATLRQLVDGGGLEIRPKTTDRYGRTVAEVYSQGRNVNLALVRAGSAYVYRQYLSGCDADAYLEAEAQAQKWRQGVWRWGGGEVKPWEFRKGA